MKSRNVESIDRLLALLDAPLDPRDAAAGWDEEARRRWRVRLLEFRKCIAAGDPPGDDVHHLTQWLSFEGVAGGPLAAEIAELQRALVNAYAKRRWGVSDREASRFLHQIGVRR